MNRPITGALNEPSQLQGLLARFPYMFSLAESDRRRAYVFFRGWMPAIAVMCEQIDEILGADKRDFKWIRIREKFGAPSLAYNMRGRARHAIHAHRPTEVRRIWCAPPEAFERSAVAVQEAVLGAELELRTTCIVCGVHSTITNAGGPWASLCVEHQSSDFLESLKNRSLWAAAAVGKN